jgi:thiol:disulfide interchange protein DsbD
MRRLWWLALVLQAAALTAVAETHPVQAELLVDATGSDGATARVGVRLTIAPGWHVYWINPGDAGLATHVELDLPEGIEAERIVWPLPSRFSDPGGIISYGYSDSLLLASNLRIPSAVRGDDSLTIRARAEWLACKERCLLGEAKLSAELIPGRQPGTKVRQLFDDWQTRLPVNSQPPFGINVSGGISSGLITVWLSWPAAASEIEWYSEPMPGVIVQDPKVRSRGSLTRIDLPISVEEGEPPKTIAALVVLDRGNKRQGYRVSAPVL